MKKLIMFLFLPVYIYSQCPGDTNEDGTVDIIDIVSTVNIIFEGETECEDIECTSNLIGHWVGTTMEGDYQQEESCGDDFIGEDNSSFHLIVYDDFTYYQYYNFYGENLSFETIGVIQCTPSGLEFCPCTDDYIDCQDDGYCNEYDIMYIDGNDMTLINNVIGQGCNFLATMYFTKE